MRRILVPLALALAVPTPLSAQGAHGDDPCPATRSYLGGFECMQVPVFENREERSGREIQLHVVILPAFGDDVAPDPVFVLPGGPGQSTAALAGHFADVLAKAREQRDLILVDYRGTGSSNALDFELEPEDLQALVSNPYPREIVERELAKLRERADLTQYTTTAIVDDLDEVREFLGYDRINLWGASYGTRVALVYLRRHGEHVRTAVLKGVAPMGFAIGRDFAVDAQRSLERCFASCAADPACSAAYGDPADLLARLFARLEDEPVVLPASHPMTGETVEVELTPAVVAQTIRMLLYVMPMQAELPRMLARGAAGELQGWADMTLAIHAMQSQELAEGLFLSVVAAEDAPLMDPEDIRTRSRGTFLGDHVDATLAEAVEGWPTAEVDPSFWEPVRSEVPVLVLSGAFDPGTPAHQGAEAARHLPNSLHLVFETGSHDDWAFRPCTDDIFEAFLRTGTVAGLDTGCAELARPIKFAVDR